MAALERGAAEFCARVAHSFAPFANEWVLETFPIAEPFPRTIVDLQG